MGFACWGMAPSGTQRTTYGQMPRVASGVEGGTQPQESGSSWSGVGYTGPRAQTAGGLHGRSWCPLYWRVLCGEGSGLEEQ